MSIETVFIRFPLLSPNIAQITACVCVLSCVQLFANPWDVAHQVPLSMEFFRQEYWSGLPFPSPRNLPNPGIKLLSPASPALAGRFFTTKTPGKRCSEQVPKKYKQIDSSQQFLAIVIKKCQECLFHDFVFCYRLAGFFHYGFSFFLNFYGVLSFPFNLKKKSFCISHGFPWLRSRRPQFGSQYGAAAEATLNRAERGRCPICSASSSFSASPLLFFLFFYLFLKYKSP